MDPRLREDDVRWRWAYFAKFKLVLPWQNIQLKLVLPWQNIQH
jgi:hypothetical protein